jgi:CubicO group peptidase (beta-lactamase class C family)
MTPPTLPPHPRDGTPAAGAIPHEDWDRTPWNHYSFQHVREFAATVPVPTAERASPLPRALQDLGAIEFECDGVRQRVDEFLAASDTDGFLVLHRGAIIAEHYGNGMGPASCHLSQSVSKSIVGTLAGILAARGQLDTRAPVTAYLPELAGTAYRGATVQQLLDMTSGVQWDETYTTPDSDCAKMDAACGWKERKHPAWPRTMWELIASLQVLEQEHGQSFRYRSIETDVLGFVLQRAGALPLAAQVSREIWAPLGAERDAYFTVDPAGFACASGGFNASLRDYGRFALMLANRGLLDGRRIVPEAWIEATRAGDAALFGPTYRVVLPEGAYHNQFWLERAHAGPYMARGVFGQLIYVDPESRFAAVKLSSWPDFINYKRVRTALAALRAIRTALASADSELE